MNQSRELSLADLVAIIRHSWLIVLGLPLFAAVGAFVIASFLSPTYRAVALLAPASPESVSSLSRLAAQFSPLSQLVGNIDSAGGLSSKEVHIATLRSRRLTEEFIRERNLLPVLFPDAWDAAANDWKVTKDGRKVPSMDMAYRLFDEKIRSISEDRATGLISLAIELGDRGAAADWANDLVARANAFTRTRAIAESRRSIAFLEAELGKTAIVERRQIIFQLIESRISAIMLANARDEYAFIIVDRAVEPDADNFVRPRRAILAVIGLALGLVLALIVATARWVTRRSGAAAR